MKIPYPSKTILFYVSCAILTIALFSSCRKKPLFDTPLGKAIINAGNFTKYTIPKAAHFSSGNNLKAVSKSDLHFIVRFDSSCNYQNELAENRADINKLYGFSDCGAQHHISSARFGWVSVGDSIELHAYVYTNAERKSKYLHTVAIDKEIEMSIAISSNAYLFKVEGISLWMPRQCNSEKIEGYQLYPYFGGDETAPHEMNIFIKEL